jgi:hemerythrin
MSDDIVVWDDIYSVGVPHIDEQHKMLVLLINDLFQILQSDDGSAKVTLVKAFNKAADYAKTHFQEEEEYMKQINYPNYPEHKKEHETFMAEVWDQFLKFQNNNLMFIELPRFLKKWLLNHIAVTDKKYGQYKA